MNRALSVLQVLEKGQFTTGSVVQMWQLAEGLGARGHRVAVVSRPGGELASRATACAMAFEPLALSREFDVVSARRLARICDERQVDIVHAHKGIAHSIALYASFLSRRRPKLVVNRGVSFPLDVFSRIKFHIRLDAVVAVSQDIKRVVVASGRVPADKVHVIYAGVDLETFNPAKTDGRRVRREWGVADDETLVVQVGAREWNGWRDFLAGAARAAETSRDLRFALVACQDEAQRRQVLAEADKLGVAARVLAIGLRADMPDVLSAADIVADLSYEGLGITGTIREAMALERPVIASAAGGNPELIVDGESGLLVTPRRPEVFAEALLQLFHGRALASRLAGAGRRRVMEHFSSGVRLDRTEALYRELVGGAG